MKQENRGIWKFARLLPPVGSVNQYTLGEGNTRLIEKDGVFFKCEFENPTGSIKDRGICYQIAVLKKNKIKHAVLSSSGNAAVSASIYCAENGISLTVFLSPSANPQKIKKIHPYATIVTSKKPVSEAFKYSLEKKIFNLRPTKDPAGYIGYKTVGFEIMEALPEADALFIPVSGGTIFKGIFNGFGKNNFLPSFHAIQSSVVCPIASDYDRDFSPETKTLADALVARISPFKNDLHSIIKKTGGSGWVIQNKAMEIYRKKLSRYGFNSSFEGAACFAALNKARQKGYRFKNPVILLTGKYYG